MPRSRLRALAAACLAAVLCGGPAASEIYRWVDAEGRVHFTQDLQKVPPSQRPEAAAAAKASDGPDPVQTYRAPARSSPWRRSARRAGSGSGRVWRIRVERAGTSMRVWGLVNGSVRVPFIVDTGASDVVIPRRYAEELQLDLDSARTQDYMTANGVVTAEVVTLDSVALGGAHAEKVPASVSASMPVGLLGLSFFNRFHYQVDPGRGIITLRRNDLEERGLVRGGRSEAQWRSEYASLRRRMERVRHRQEVVPSSHSRTHEELEEQLEELERQYESLEAEADHARVPFGWRE